MATRTVRTGARAMLESLPEDGLRHEAIEGVHVVTPAPTYLHQRVVFELGLALRQVLSSGEHAVVAGGNITSDTDTVLIPDLVVVHGRPEGLYVSPDQVALAVEVLSPSTRARDLTSKARLFGSWSVAYWVVDPMSRTLLLHDAGRVVGVLGADELISGHGFDLDVTVGSLFT